MKFRNASKNYDAIEQYDVRNRPFYVALKIMDIFKQKGNNVVSNSTISYYVKTITNEDEIDYNEIEEIDTENWSNNLKREISRGSTFLKRHLEIGFGIQTIRIGTQSFYSLKNFDIKKYKCKSKAIFIGDYYDDIEITPKLIKALMYPTKIEDTGYKRKLIDLQFIKNNEAICDFNIDTDLADRNLVEQVLYSIPTQDIVIEHVENVPYYSEGKMISESGQGTHYEKFLYKILVQKFGDSRIKYLGANTVVRSDAILERILNNYMNLLCRMDNQIDGFEIQTYPNEVDSFMRIKINQLNSKNEMLNEILNQRK